MLLYYRLLCFVGAVILSSAAAHDGGTNNEFVYLKDLYANVTDAGQPLFLTPLIEAGRIREAQHLSRVEPFVGDIASYAGYLTINKHYNSNLLFWFFPSIETDWTESPVTLWLQGGPGYSGFFALFNENGPYFFDNDTIKLREYTWNRKSNLIFIDSPAGTAYSFTESKHGYARDQTDVGNQLYEAMVQFFRLFPQLRTNPFYITGESYAGKYIPALGYTIHRENPSAELKINLKGLFIGNGLTDPVNMIPLYGEQLYSLGLIDYNVKREFEKLQNKAVRAIHKEDWEKATIAYTQLIIGYSFYPYPTLYNNVTGIDSYYNYVNPLSGKWQQVETDFITSNFFRKAIHVGNTTRDPGSTTELMLKQDIAKSVIYMVKELVEHYRVTFYNGQLDIICAYPLTENFLSKMKWSGWRNFRNSQRSIWRVDNEIAGYVKTSGTLSHVLVRNCGHMVPTEQPKWAFQLFDHFIHNIPLV